MKTSTIKLTKRQWEVLRMRCVKRMSPKAIADELYISKRTVDFHLVELFARLNVNSVDQLALAAQAHGLID